nr:unnamed protein product [Digitaria exilis]
MAMHRQPNDERVPHEHVPLWACLEHLRCGLDATTLCVEINEPPRQHRGKSDIVWPELLFPHPVEQPHRSLRRTSLGAAGDYRAPRHGVRRHGHPLEHLPRGADPAGAHVRVHQRVVGDDVPGGGGHFVEHPARGVRERVPGVERDERVGDVRGREEVADDRDGVEGEPEREVAAAGGGGDGEREGVAGGRDGEAEGGAEEEEEESGGEEGAPREAGVGGEEERVGPRVGEGEVAGDGGERVRREEAAQWEAAARVEEVGQGVGG